VHQPVSVVVLFIQQVVLVAVTASSTSALLHRVKTVKYVVN